MPKGIYAAASAMVAESRQMETVARNLANLQTPGYRREVHLRSTFQEMLAAAGRRGGIKEDGGAGVVAQASHRDLRQGRLQPTGALWDLGLHGDGFFLVRNAQGSLLLTRAGHFEPDAEGRLHTPEGFVLQGQGGDLVVPPGSGRVMVGEDGTVSTAAPVEGAVAMAVVDRLRIVTVAHPERLRAATGQYFPVDGQPLVDAADTRVMQGTLEAANLDPVQELVQMISLNRRYEAASKALREQSRAGEGLSDILRT